MKINFIVIGLFHSGGMRIIFEYANRLSLLGHDVVLYKPMKPYTSYKKSIISELRTSWVMVKGIFKKNEQIDLYEYNFKIKKVPLINNLFLRKADVNIATTWPTAYSLDKLSESKGKKIHFIQDYEIWNSDIELVNRSFQLNMKKITISLYNQKLFQEKFKIDSEVILNGLNYEIYNCKNKSKNNNRIITFIDHPLSSKGVENAIEVVKRLNIKYNDLKFISFGHTMYHNIPDFVMFYENPDDVTVVKEIYSKTDIFIYPSIKEGFALPPAEAMACNCSVVTTKVGAVPEYSIHMESAIHVEPNDIDELFNGVCYLLENKNEMIRISENAYNYVRQKLNWDESVKNFEKYLIN